MTEGHTPIGFRDDVGQAKALSDQAYMLIRRDILAPLIGAKGAVHSIRSRIHESRLVSQISAFKFSNAS